MNMSKFTTQQLQAALKELYVSDNTAAYQLAFDELESRMGEDAFDSFLDTFM